ncbi:MAG: S9 family peptidase [Candidatus Sericytochromatia bacterium]|nr:S9 family peptidase [Candidatus Tanganyikabacteria bacterium]
MRNLLAFLVAAALLAGLGTTRPAHAEQYSIGQYLNIRSSAGGVFTPDGQDIVFLTAITGVPQIWRVPRNSGWPDQLTFYRDAVRHLTRSPAGDWLLFGKDAGGDERVQLYLTRFDGSETVQLTDDPKVIHSFGAFSHDGKRVAYASNARDQAFFDVYVLDLGTRAARRVVTHDGNNYPLAFTRDGKALVYSRVETPSDENLYLLDLATGKERLLTPHSGNANYDSVTVGRDGKLYLASDQDSEFKRLAVLDPATARLQFLTRDDIGVESVAMREDGSRLAYLVNRDGYSDMFTFDVGGVLPRRVPNVPQGVIYGLDWSPDGQRIAFTYTGPRDNANIWLVDLATGRPAQVTRSALAGIPRASFVAPSLISYPSFDGRKIPAFYYLPKGVARDGSLPTIVFLHGGPESQERPDFAANFQYYLSRGYAVFTPNIRGSTGYGKTYTHLDDVRKRKDALRDVEFGVKWLKEAGYADSSKLVVMGGSYGGYLTLACLTMQPDLWAAGIDSVGMSNLVTFLENTGPWRRKLREAEYGSLSADRDFLAEVSPVNHLDKIRAPLLVEQGANDPRVPRSEADQIVATLRQKGHPVEYLLLADEGHGVVKLENRLKSFETKAEFLDRYVRNRAAATGAR